MGFELHIFLLIKELPTLAHLADHPERIISYGRQGRTKNSNSTVNTTKEGLVQKQIKMHHGLIVSYENHSNMQYKRTQYHIILMCLFFFFFYGWDMKMGFLEKIHMQILQMGNTLPCLSKSQFSHE